MLVLLHIFLFIALPGLVDCIEEGEGEGEGTDVCEGTGACGGVRTRMSARTMWE